MSPKDTSDKMEVEQCDSEAILQDGYHDCILPKHHSGKHEISQQAHLESKWRVSSCQRIMIKVGRSDDKTSTKEARK